MFKIRLCNSWNQRVLNHDECYTNNIAINEFNLSTLVNAVSFDWSIQVSVGANQLQKVVTE